MKYIYLALNACAAFSFNADPLPPPETTDDDWEERCNDYPTTRNDPACIAPALRLLDRDD